MPPTKPPQEEIKKSLRYSLWDGASWSLTVGFAELYFSPFAIFLGAADVILGLLSTLPQLAGAISQLVTPVLVKKIGSRKRVVLSGVAAQGGMLLFFMLSPFFHPYHLFFLLAVACLYWISWMITVPAWESWMGDIVPEKRRGAYFGRRNQIIQLVMFGALVGGGWILNLFQTYRGFLILIVLGLIGRLLSLIFIGKQTEPRGTDGTGPVPSFVGFLKTIHRNNFGRFVLFVALFAVAMNVASPYFVQYMLDELRFSYLQFMAVFAAMIGVKFVTIPFWGRFSDRYGTRKLIIPSCLLLSLAPLLWLCSSNFYYILFIQIVAGVGIGGFELLSFNFLLDSTRPEDRTRNAAYYQVLMGVGIVAGSVVGGLIMKFSLFDDKTYFAIFLLSALLRLAISAGFLPRLKEIREVESISYRKLLSQVIRFQKSVVE